MVHRRQFIAGAALSLGTLPIRSAMAQGYPSRSVRWVVPFPAGGAVDTIARKTAELLAPKVQQAIVVENKPGAGGAIGTLDVVRAKPDGHTLGFATTDTLVSAMLLIKEPGYDAKSDLSLIGKLCHSQQLLIVPAKSGIQDIRSLVAAAKAKRLTFATWGPGTIPHLYMKTLESAAGIEMVDVPYKGLMPAVQDLVGGQIDVALVPPSLAMPFHQKGQVNVVSVSGGARLTQFPQVATVQEQGLKAPMFDYTYWAGLVGPRGLPSEIRNFWMRHVLEVQSTPEFITSLVPLGMDPSRRIGADFEADVAKEFDVIAGLTRRLGITPT